MAYAHSQRVIHRDLKPSNILVGEFGETVVIDWGLAKELDRPEAPRCPRPRAPRSRGPDRTQLGTVLGTPAYMPPEQAAGQPVDERADVYALGAILYHLLSGQPPYTGTTSRRCSSACSTRSPARWPSSSPGSPRSCWTIVSRAMAREPAQRYPTARELAEDLRRFQRASWWARTATRAWERVRRFVRRHRAALIVAAAGAGGARGGRVLEPPQRIVAGAGPAPSRSSGTSRRRPSARPPSARTRSR